MICRYERLGVPQVECRLSIGSKGLTNTKVNFQYFSVGDATKTVAFGPGLLRGTAPAVPVVFMIQARDKVIFAVRTGIRLAFSVGKDARGASLQS